MIPEWVSTRRSRYKNDTKTFLTWLVDEAIRHGYTPVTKPVQPHDNRSQADINRHRTKSASEGELRAIRTGDIVACAAAIVRDKAARFRVPAFVLEAAERAIEERQKCTLWYKNQVSNDLEGSLLAENETHEHFTERLREAIALLKPLGQQVSHPRNRDKNVDPLSNAFQMLDVEDVQQENIEQASEMKPNASEVVHKPTTYTVEDEDKNECPLAISMFLEDIFDIRAAILSTWIYYFSRNVDLVAAGVTAQAGLQMLRAMIQQLVSEFPQLTSMEELMKEFLREPELVLDNKALEDLLVTESVGDKQIMCLDTYKDVLDIITSTTSRGAFRESVRDSEDGKASRRKGSKETSIGFDRKRSLTSFIGHIACLFDHQQNKITELPIMDNITRVWYEHLSRLPKARTSRLKKPPSCSIELVVFSQVFLDLQGLIAPVAKRTQKLFEDYDNFAWFFELSEVEKLVKTALKLWPQAMKVTHPFGRDPEVVTSYAAWLKDEPIREAGAAHGKRIAIGAWMKLNPVLGSLILFTAAEGIFHMRLCLVTTWGTLLSQAHLYNALRQMKRRTEAGKSLPLLNRTWKDMETFIRVFGEKGIFRGPRPQTITKCIERYQNALGVSSSDQMRYNTRNSDGKIGIGGGTFDIGTIPIIRAIFGNRGDKQNFLNILAGPVRSAFTKKVDSLGFTKDFKGHLDQMYLPTFRTLLRYELPKLYFQIDKLASNCKTVQTSLFEGLDWGFDNLHMPLPADEIIYGEAIGNNHRVCYNIIHREATAHGPDNDEAISRMIKDAGRIVTRELYMLQTTRSSATAEAQTDWWERSGRILAFPTDELADLAPYLLVDTRLHEAVAGRLQTLHRNEKQVRAWYDIVYASFLPPDDRRDLELSEESLETRKMFLEAITSPTRYQEVLKLPEVAEFMADWGGIAYARLLGDGEEDDTSVTQTLKEDRQTLLVLGEGKTVVKIDINEIPQTTNLVFA